MSEPRNPVQVGVYPVPDPESLDAALEAAGWTLVEVSGSANDGIFVIDVDDEFAQTLLDEGWAEQTVGDFRFEAELA
jgi:hypothetical protein